ncbi:MAG: hypothetical protein ACRDRJ_43705 [Streptosporangiaceae bacterium]
MTSPSRQTRVLYRQPYSAAGRRKGGLFAALAEEKSAEIGRLAAEAARSLGCGDAGMEAAEAVIRAGMLKLGAAGKLQGLRYTKQA